MLSQAPATRINAFVSNIYWGAINFVCRQLYRKTVKVNFKEGLKLQILRIYFLYILVVIHHRLNIYYDDHGLILFSKRSSSRGNIMFFELTVRCEQ